MAHYAFLNSDNEVISVITGVDEWVTQTDLDGSEVGGSTQAWEAFYAGQPWHGAASCKRTSYNTHGSVHSVGGNPYRKNYAGIGYTYDTERDAFIAPQPYASWVLEESTCVWEAPVPYPATGRWQWDESVLNWVEIQVQKNF